eukprot:5605443-Pyramimonas_sp.AAC.1
MAGWASIRRRRRSAKRPIRFSCETTAVGWCKRCRGISKQVLIVVLAAARAAQRSDGPMIFDNRF